MIRFHYGHPSVNDTIAHLLKGNGPTLKLNNFGFWTGTKSTFSNDYTLQEVIRIGQQFFYPHKKLREGGMKGAWFYHSPGSGIFMDTGKTLKCSSRFEFVKRFNISIRLPKNYPFALDYTNLTCHYAQQYGFHTVQFKSVPLEIVNCRKIITDVQPHLHDTCAFPLQFLWSNHSSKLKRCECNSNYPILNCRGF